MSSSSGRRRFLRALGLGAGGLAVPAVADASVSARGVGPTARFVDITDQGARGDGRFNNRLAIQRAIDQCADRGGGTVYIPPGRFVTGTVHLRSHVRLLLDAGAVLAGSPDPAEYELRAPLPHTPPDAWGSALLLADGCEDVAIVGHGTITGGRLALTPSGERGPFRPRLIAIERCRDVVVKGVTLRDSDRWTLHLYQSDHVRVRGLGIYAGLQVLNTDGIDIDGCSNVLVSDCDIAVGDDCVCLKTTDYLGPPRPCRNVTVTNCALATRSSGFKIGTETHHDFANVVFSNSVIYAREGTEPHTGIALQTVDGAHLSGVAVSNIAMDGVIAPIFLRLGNRGRRQQNPVPGTLRDVVIDNVVATGASLASSITGIPGHDVENVSLQNVRIQMRGGGGADVARRVVEERIADYPRATMFGELPAHGLYVRHVSDLSLRDIHVRTARDDARPVLIADDVAGLRVDGLGGGTAEGAESAVRLRNVRGATVGGLSLAPGAGSWVRVEGRRSEGVLLRNDTFTDASTQVTIADGAPGDSVRVRN